MTSRRPLIIILPLLLTLAACKTPGAAPRAFPEPRPELGEPATRLGPDESLPPNSAPPQVTTTVPPSPRASDPSASQAATTTTTTKASTSIAPRAAYSLAVVDDPGGTTGAAPGYADVKAVTYVHDDDRLKIVVDVAAPFPAFKEREVLGIGVDLYRSNDRESDYQLFADGGINGWRAYLQTPDGFIEYPGTFAVGTTRLQFEVPWSSVGGEKSFRTAVFADWSSRENLLPQSGGDRAPDQGFADVSTS